VCGVAKDVCVANTVMDMLQDEEENYTNKLIFLEPGMAALDPRSPMNQVFADAAEHLGAEILKDVD
jgi:nicotinamidase-related amidase